MILDEGRDKHGKFFKASLIDRFALTLENYAGGDWGGRFYSEEFLTGFCARRNEIHAALGKSASSLAVATLLLAFIQSIEGAVSFWGVEFSVPEFGGLVLCLVISLNFFVTVGNFINQLQMDRFLYVLGQRIGAYDFEVALLNLTAQNLWTGSLKPRHHGLSSGTLQILANRVITGFFRILLLALISVVLGVVVNAILSSEPHTFGAIEWAIVSLIGFVFLFSFLLIVIFSLSYKFRVSGLAEPAKPFIPDSYIEMGHPFDPRPTRNPTDQSPKNTAE